MNPIFITGAAILLACAAFAVSTSLVPRGSRLTWTVISGALAVGATAAITISEPNTPIALAFSAVLCPWLIWLPAAVAYGSVRRLQERLPPFRKRTYFALVCLLCLLQGLSLETPDTSLFLMSAAALGSTALTYPLGLAGATVTIPLIYFGIATKSEAFAVGAPIYAAAGLIQWYAVVPWIVRSRRRVAARPNNEASQETPDN